MGFRLYLRLAIAGILGGVLLIFTQQFFWQGLVAMALGVLSLVFGVRGLGRLGRWEPSNVRGPDFAVDEPEVAALPPTTTTRLSEQIKQARERQRREQG